MIFLCHTYTSGEKILLRNTLAVWTVVLFFFTAAFYDGRKKVCICSFASDSNSFVSLPLLTIFHDYEWSWRRKTTRWNANCQGDLSGMVNSVQWMDPSHYCPATIVTIVTIVITTIVHIHSVSICFHHAPLASSSPSVSSCQQEFCGDEFSAHNFVILFINVQSVARLAWKLFLYLSAPFTESLSVGKRK